MTMEWSPQPPPLVTAHQNPVVAIVGAGVAADGRVVARAGTPVDSLYYLGPWLRARDWEATAVPELRAHAAHLAQRILAQWPEREGLQIPA